MGYMTAYHPYVSAHTFPTTLSIFHIVRFPIKKHKPGCCGFKKADVSSYSNNPTLGVCGMDDDTNHVFSVFV
jgi:hypothetical protein